MLGFALVVYTKKLSNGHFFSFLSFCYFFSFSFDTLNQYCYILCLIHQCECINVSVNINMYISIDTYNIITDTLIRSFYQILPDIFIYFDYIFPEKLF